METNPHHWAISILINISISNLKLWPARRHLAIITHLRSTPLLGGPLFPPAGSPSPASKQRWPSLPYLINPTILLHFFAHFLKISSWPFQLGINAHSLATAIPQQSRNLDIPTTSRRSRFMKPKHHYITDSLRCVQLQIHIQNSN